MEFGGNKGICMMWFWDVIKVNALLDIFSVVSIIVLTIKVHSLEKEAKK